MDDFVENTTSSMQQEEKKADDNDDIEKAVTATNSTTPYDAIQQFNHSEQQPSREKTIWTDDRGNLKVVNMVVRYPCVIFWFLIVLVILLTFILNALVFRTAENGNVSSIHIIFDLRFNSTFLLVALSLNAFTVSFFSRLRFPATNLI